MKLVDRVDADLTEVPAKIPDLVPPVAFGLREVSLRPRSALKGVTIWPIELSVMSPKKRRSPRSVRP